MEAASGLRRYLDAPDLVRSVKEAETPKTIFAS